LPGGPLRVPSVLPGSMSSGSSSTSCTASPAHCLQPAHPGNLTSWPVLRVSTWEPPTCSCVVSVGTTPRIDSGLSPASGNVAACRNNAPMC
jgi:hypothetical protein